MLGSLYASGVALYVNQKHKVPPSLLSQVQIVWGDQRLSTNTRTPPAANRSASFFSLPPPLSFNVLSNPQTILNNTGPNVTAEPSSSQSHLACSYLPCSLADRFRAQLPFVLFTEGRGGRCYKVPYSTIPWLSWPAPLPAPPPAPQSEPEERKKFDVEMSFSETSQRITVCFH